MSFKVFVYTSQTIIQINSASGDHFVGKCSNVPGKLGCAWAHVPKCMHDLLAGFGIVSIIRSKDIDIAYSKTQSSAFSPQPASQNS